MRELERKREFRIWKNLPGKYTYRSSIIPRSSILRLSTIQPHTLHTPPSQYLLVDSRHAFAFKMDQMRHIPRPNLLSHILTMRESNTTTLFTRSSDRSNKVRGAEAARLAVEATVQDEDLEAGTAGTSDGRAHTLEDERWDDGRVEAADAVDQGFCNVDGF